MALPGVDPLALLHAMQEETRRTAPGLPEQEQAAELWSGLGFRLADLMLVAPLGQVAEVLPCPEITPVPGTKPWLRGVANVRGNLYSIVDLPTYFGKEAVHGDVRARLLILNVPELRAAVLVHEVMGMRHFEEAHGGQDLSALDDPALVHVRGAFLRDNVLWAVFDMHALAQSPTFLDVAA